MQMHNKEEQMNKYLVVLLWRPNFLRLHEADKDGQGGNTVENHVLWKQCTLDTGEGVTRQNEK